MKKLISLLALGFVLAIPAASALTQAQLRECQALSKSIGPATASLEEKNLERDALAEETEAAGEAWENAENIRTLSADKAAIADSLKATYEDFKDRLNTFEGELFDSSQKLNKDVFRFNTLCVT